MDSEQDLPLEKLAKAHNLLVVQVLGLMALVGAMTELAKPDPERVAAWCDIVTRGQAGTSQVSVQNVADAILNYVRANAPQRPSGE